MKVLVACEFSGIVRNAFISRGHDAWSCDQLPSERPGPHVQNDVRRFKPLQQFDLLIAHPPCTYLCSSGARWWKDRRTEQKDAVDFVRWLMDCPVPHIAIENPVGILSTLIHKPDQIVQPWQFGHPEWKTTCLWLKNLPKLRATDLVQPDATVGGGKKPGRISSRLHRLSGKNRWKERSRTFQGIADAMAEQWG